MPPKKQQQPHRAKGSASSKGGKKQGDDDFDTILKMHNKETAKDRQKAENDKQKLDAANKKLDQAQQKLEAGEAKQQQRLAVAAEKELVREMEQELLIYSTTNTKKDDSSGSSVETTTDDKVVGDPLASLPPIYVDDVAKYLYLHLGGEARADNFTNMFWLAYSLQTFYMSCLEAKRKLLIRTPGALTTEDEAGEEKKKANEEVLSSFEVHDKDKFGEHCWNLFTTESGAQYCIDLTLSQFELNDQYRPEVSSFTPVLAPSRLLAAQFEKKESLHNKPKPKKVNNNQKSAPAALLEMERKQKQKEKLESNAGKAHQGVLSIEAGIYPGPSYEAKSVISEGVPAGTSKAYRLFLKKSQKHCLVGMNDDEKEVADQVATPYNLPDGSGKVEGTLASKMEEVHKMLVKEFVTKPLMELRKTSKKEAQ